MTTDTDDETMIPVSTLELLGAIVQHNADDLAHTHSILLAMAEDKAKFFAEALTALHAAVERAIPYELRPMSIEKALQGADWKVSEAFVYLGRSTKDTAGGGIA